MASSRKPQRAATGPAVLAIDAGNTRLKWGVHDGRRWLKTGHVENARAAGLKKTFSSLPALRMVIVSNVAGAALRAAIQKALPAPLAIHWLRSAAMQCGVRNSYAKPAQLGCDRWAALIAARSMHTGAAVVVNAGTALTVDSLTADGVFVGGIIAPGAEVMRAALAGHTAGLRRRPGKFSFFPDNTGDAIMSGAINALCGAVERTARHLQEACGQVPVCILSGGAAGLIAPQLNLEVRLVDNLVLEGLAVIARGT